MRPARHRCEHPGNRVSLENQSQPPLYAETHWGTVEPAGRRERGKRTHSGSDPVEKPYPKSRILASGSYSSHGEIMKRPRFARAAAGVVALVFSVLPLRADSDGPGSISRADLKEWLSYIASDELQGRAVFSSGLGMAAAYVTNHLRAWGVTPACDNGSYLQTVRVLGVKATSHSTLTVQIGNDSRTFADGDAISLQRNAGGKRRLTVDRIEFVGYGFDLPAAQHIDVAGKNLKGAAVVWLGADGPNAVDAQKYRLLLSQRGRHIDDVAQAAASIGPELPGRGRRGSDRSTDGDATAGGRRASPNATDFTTVERLDKTPMPTVRAKDAFLEYLFSRAPIRYDELKRKAASREPLPSFRLDHVKLTFNIDVD